VDHYRTLQVTRDADPEVIDRAYRALSRKHHPDLAGAGGTEHSTEKMKAINEAYRVLGDPSRRAAYDATLVPEHAKGWDVLWERGLVGLFLERYGSHSR